MKLFGLSCGIGDCLLGYWYNQVNEWLRQCLSCPFTRWLLYTALYQQSMRFVNIFIKSKLLFYHMLSTWIWPFSNPARYDAGQIPFTFIDNQLYVSNILNRRLPESQFGSACVVCRPMAHFVNSKVNFHFQFCSWSLTFSACPLLLGSECAQVYPVNNFLINFPLFANLLILHFPFLLVAANCHQPTRHIISWELD